MTLPVVLFVDGTCPKPYTPDTFNSEGSGATEASVMRVAEGLAALGLFKVYVEQLNREKDEHFAASYCKPESILHADYVICLRYPPLLTLMRKRFPRASLYLWSHDLATPALGESLPEIIESGCVANLVVSNYHKTQTTQVLIPAGYTGQFQTTVVFNPISDELQPDGTPYDKNKLIWTSSPHKNLLNALDIFRNLRSFNPDFTLYVANPGYLPNHDAQQEGVVSLGSLPHPEVIKHLRTALCLFYPNWTFPETFGVSIVESEAVGTPVLTHPIGASSEVTSHPYELLDCRNPKGVIDRIMSWHSGDRPRVKANPKFRLSEVLKSWIRLFR